MAYECAFPFLPRQNKPSDFQGQHRNSDQWSLQQRSVLIELLPSEQSARQLTVFCYADLRSTSV